MACGRIEIIAWRARTRVVVQTIIIAAAAESGRRVARTWYPVTTVSNLTLDTRFNPSLNFSGGQLYTD